MRRPWLYSTVLAAIPLLIAATAAASSTPIHPDPGSRPRIVNGVNTHGYPATGALLYGPDGAATLDSARGLCTATLIGCRTVLTAGHCLDDPNPSHYLVFFQHGGAFAVGAVARHPLYRPDSPPVADVGVLTLTRAVTGIAPVPIVEVDPQGLLGSDGTIAGFGDSGRGFFDYGIKRVGRVVTASCDPVLANGATDADAICWDFEDPVGPAGEDANTCFGDSGGPLFLDLGAGAVIAGITSGGTSGDCHNDHSFDASVFAVRDFVRAQLGDDSTAACGTLPPVGDGRTVVVERDGGLNPAHGSDLFSVDVPAGATTLRVTVNAQEGALDADLYVAPSGAAGPENFACASDSSGSFESCVVDRPAPGPWSVRVARFDGAGAYQLTAGVFAGPPAQCGDGFAESDEACDGADDSSCRGLCRSDCTCPPSTCGNDIVESGEVCDGVDAARCPQGCASDCACKPDPPIGCGESVAGILTPEDRPLGDGTWFDAYALTLDATRLITIDLTSAEFTGYVIVRDEQGEPVADGESPLTATLPPGRYAIWANNEVPLADGTYPYELSVSCGGEAQCGGDCDQSGTVDISELIHGVLIALGEDAPATCLAVDTDADGQVAINDLVAAVGAALTGCR